VLEGLVILSKFSMTFAINAMYIGALLVNVGLNLLVCNA
jgi:hypothetical protein